MAAAAAASANKPNSQKQACSNSRCGKEQNGISCICNGLWYCSFECQSVDHERHGKPCIIGAAEIKETKDCGRGLFARRAFASREEIGVELSWFSSKDSIYGIVLSLMTCYGKNAVRALHKFGFTQKRTTRLPDQDAIVEQICQLTNKCRKDTMKVDTKMVDEAMGIVQQYQICQSPIGVDGNQGSVAILHRLICTINHSCNPNAALRVPNSKSVLNAEEAKVVNQQKHRPITGHLVSYRAIAKGEQITITYRDLMGVDSYRAFSQFHLYDLFNYARCQCGDALCAHKDMSVTDILQLWNTLHAYQTHPATYWTSPLELLEELDGKDASTDVKTDAKKTNRLVERKKYIARVFQDELACYDPEFVWHVIMTSPKQIKTPEAALKLGKPIEERLTQVLVLLGQWIACEPGGIVGFAKAIDIPDAVVRTWFAMAFDILKRKDFVKLKETEFYLAKLQISLFPSGSSSSVPFSSWPIEILNRFC